MAGIAFIPQLFRFAQEEKEKAIEARTKAEMKAIVFEGPKKNTKSELFYPVASIASIASWWNDDEAKLTLQIYPNTALLFGRQLQADGRTLTLTVNCMGKIYANTSGTLAIGWVKLDPNRFQPLVIHADDGRTLVMVEPDVHTWDALPYSATSQQQLIIGVNAEGNRICIHAQPGNTPNLGDFTTFHKTDGPE